MTSSPSFREALRYWFRLGWINFGGPAGQIALMHRDLVDRRRWIGEDAFLHALNFCMLLPGPEAQQLATYVGWRLHGTRGALAAGIFFVLPSVLVLWALSAIYALWGSVPAVAGALAGIQPMVVALVGEAVVRIGRRAFRHPVHVLFAAAAFVALAAFHLPFPAVVALAALAGALAGRLVPGFAARDNEGSPADEGVVAPAPRARRPWRILATATLLWAIPLGLVVGVATGAPLLREIYLFFTRAAFVTFGGAYAVLAYVSQVAVERFGWLGRAEMVHGLALAETTPGPLIMVLQFVGFLAAWHHPGALPPLLAATLGALLTTWATFLPSVTFILLGAPYIERLRRSRAVAAALAGVTAAVVGVVLHLAFTFGRVVLVPGGKPDLFALAIAAAALVALVRFRVEAGWMIVAGAALGLARAAIAG
jgi:chromate transporter